MSVSKSETWRAAALERRSVLEALLLSWLVPWLVVLQEKLVDAQESLGELVVQAQLMRSARF